ncbi:hypothetical protein ACFOU2_20745 [Bacillus songklensis]|uniref:Transposase n=1 Tax=Bacillus songklensis TaxID=1069116 RepID=A0ABV8B8U9_9BACI
MMGKDMTKSAYSNKICVNFRKGKQFYTMCSKKESILSPDAIRIILGRLRFRENDVHKFLEKFDIHSLKQLKLCYHKRINGMIFKKKVCLT